MKKEEMVIGKEYLHCESTFNERYVFSVESDASMNGCFMGAASGIDYVFSLSNMTKAPEAKPEFEFDEEIEVSNNPDFPEMETYKRYLLLDLNASKYWKSGRSVCPRFKTINNRGEVAPYHYARKVEPMVTGYINRKQYRATEELWKVFNDAADKIIAGGYS